MCSVALMVAVLTSCQQAEAPAPDEAASLDGTSVRITHRSGADLPYNITPTPIPCSTAAACNFPKAISASTPRSASTRLPRYAATTRSSPASTAPYRNPTSRRPATAGAGPPSHKSTHRQPRHTGGSGFSAGPACFSPVVRDYSLYPNRLSCRSSLRQSGLTLTKSCRNTFLPRNFSSSSRASVPTFLSFDPWCPITIPFCDSRAT